MTQPNYEQVTERVRAFYEQNPYPGLGDSLGMRGARRISSYCVEPGKILFPGCGTGHGMVALAKLRPDHEVYGLDLSDPSVEIARQLGGKHDVVTEVKRGDYMQPLPWPFKFRYMSLQGTLHHTANPGLALVNLVGHLEEDGLIFINLYGRRYHQRRQEIVKMLDLLQQREGGPELRFALFKAMRDRSNKKGVKNAVMDLSLHTVWRWVRRSYYRVQLRIAKEARPVPWTAEFKELNQLWMDQYNHPNEHLYDVSETRALLELANLEVVEMFSAGRVKTDDLPEAWLPYFKRLDSWSQYRVMELYYPTGGSINLLARKIS